MILNVRNILSNSLWSKKFSKCSWNFSITSSHWNSPDFPLCGLNWSAIDSSLPPSYKIKISGWITINCCCIYSSSLSKTAKIFTVRLCRPSIKALLSWWLCSYTIILIFLPNMPILSVRRSRNSLFRLETSSWQLSLKSNNYRTLSKWAMYFFLLRSIWLKISKICPIWTLISSNERLFPLICKTIFSVICITKMRMITEISARNLFRLDLTVFNRSTFQWWTLLW